METAATVLSEAVDNLLSADIQSLSDAELHELVVRVQCQRARLGAVAAAALSRWDRRRVWEADQSVSAPARLARDTNTSLTSARVELRRARRSRTMPLTLAAVAAGRLSLDHLDLLARANQPERHTQFTNDEELLVNTCAGQHFKQAAAFVEYWTQRVDAAGAERQGKDQQNRSRLYASATWDGMVVLNGELDPVSGEIFLNELKRLEAKIRRADRAAGTDRTPAQRRAAALVEMATRSGAMPAGSRRPQPLFTVLVGDDTARRLCELANGAVIAPGLVVPWLGNAQIESIIFDGPTTVLATSHRRAFTGAVRRAIQVRDRHCQHVAGCDIPAPDCDVDHIVPYSEGGITSQFSGRLECVTQNRRARMHDHGATPRPERPVTRLDVIRARLRWQVMHENSTGDRGADGDGNDHADASVAH